MYPEYQFGGYDEAYEWDNEEEEQEACDDIQADLKHDLEGEE